MKKYLAFFLLLSVTALVYGRPQKLVIKTRVVFTTDYYSIFYR